MFTFNCHVIGFLSSNAEASLVVQCTLTLTTWFDNFNSSKTYLDLY